MYVQQGCQIFLGTIYQNGTKYTKFTKGKNVPKGHIYTKWPKNILNGTKIYLSFQGPPKNTQIGIFGMKIYHLATLPSMNIRKHTSIDGKFWKVSVSVFRSRSISGLRRHSAGQDFWVNGAEPCMITNFRS
jgi:hypothetical protein